MLSLPELNHVIHVLNYFKAHNLYVRARQLRDEIELKLGVRR